MKAIGKLIYRGAEATEVEKSQQPATVAELFPPTWPTTSTTT
jgi:hypothetical protein